MRYALKEYCMHSMKYPVLTEKFSYYAPFPIAIKNIRGIS